MANDSISALANAKCLSNGWWEDHEQGLQVIKRRKLPPLGTVKVNVDAAMSVNALILRVVVQDEMQSILKLGQRKVKIQWSFDDGKICTH